MSRRLTKLLGVLTAVTCVLAILISVRSHFIRDELRVSGDRCIDLILARGVVILAVESKFSGQTGNYNYRNVVAGDRLWLGNQSGRRVATFHTAIRSDAASRIGPLGFSLSRVDRTGAEGLFQSVRVVSWQVSVPVWFCAAMPLALCVVAARNGRKTAAKSEICPRCGYDLRATPERCPECGTAALAIPNNHRSREMVLRE